MKKFLMIALVAFAASSAQAANVCTYVNAKHIDENSSENTILTTAGYQSRAVAPAGTMLPPNRACIDGENLKFEAPVCVQSGDDHCGAIKYVPTTSPIKGETRVLKCVKWEQHGDSGLECVKHEWTTATFEYATSYDLEVFASKHRDDYNDFSDLRHCFTKHITLPACK